MKSPVRLSTLAAGVFACTLAALPVPASARQHQHPPIEVPAGDIKIHGHWVIDVRNPDGTPAARREFDNAVTTAGGPRSANLLLAIRGRAVLRPVGHSAGDGPCKGISTFVAYGP